MALLPLVGADGGAVETAPARDALYDDLTSNMSCQCGCGTTIKTCPHEDCSSAIPARKELHEMVDAGLSRQEIVAKMVSRHGEAIMASPAFSGFNIMAWVMPFVAIVMVGFIVARIIRRWSAPSTAAGPARVESAPDGDDPYVKKVRDEIKRYEE